MNKAQLIETLLQQCPDWKKPRVAEVVDLVFDRIMEQLRAGQKVEIAALAVSESVIVAPRKAAIPKPASPWRSLKNVCRSISVGRNSKRC